VPRTEPSTPREPDEVLSADRDATGEMARGERAGAADRRGLATAAGDALGDPETLAARFGASLAARLAEVERELVGLPLVDLRRVLDDTGRDAETLRDGLSTQLMELYRVHQARSCFALLYELNRVQILAQVTQRLRRYSSRSDPHDLLQEVFFNVYRYPKRFDSTRDDAFRVWTATIVRNTVLKHLRSLGRSGRVEVPFEDLSEHPESRNEGPLGGAIERESEGECRRVYLYHLHLYLEFYKQLSPRERRALELVEVENVSYREAADMLGIRLENLKMVVFRARRKIYKAMRRVYDGLTPELRPARDGAATRTAAASLDPSEGSDVDGGGDSGPMPQGSLR